MGEKSLSSRKTTEILESLQRALLPSYKTSKHCPLEAPMAQPLIVAQGLATG